MSRLVPVLLLLIPILLSAGENLAPLVSAKAAILMDRQTGLVLWEKNADWRLPMASTTKIMTAMVILDHGGDRLDETVTVSQRADDVEGSSLFGAGDTLTLRDLLKGALIRSSNEATIAAAEYLTPTHTVAEFVGWMNDKAGELGLTRTRFVNTHGLYEEGHYSSARDLAVMTRHALSRYPLIREISKVRFTQVEALPRGMVNLENRNKLLGQAVPNIPGSIFDGVKTGYVRLSGPCLVSSATLNGWQLIGVVLNSPDMWLDTKALLHYGFTRYEWHTYAGDDTAAYEAPVAFGAARRAVPVGAKTPLGVPVMKLQFRGGGGDDEVRFTPARALRAPIARGEEIGTLSVYRDGRALIAAPAVALRAVPVAGWLRALRVIGYALGALLLLVIVGKLYGTRAKTARRRRRKLAAQRGEADPGRPGDR
ncbi:MAG: D-alanyl-D-alanine carboxypeptidase DacF precursor [bacterium ADurb.Bin429]|nr:MAG: D-alanyl-D-alanine carboxypeptidase DacF precursor [bacterium ADurb.Bin429]